MNLLDLNNMPLAGISLIEASAGTGKTYTISQLVLRLILEPQPGLKDRPLRIEEILVVTFTKAATQELKDRIRQNVSAGIDYLDAFVEKPDATLVSIIDQAIDNHGLIDTYQRLRQALLFLDDAPIFTIHGFCQRILADFSFSTGQVYDQVLKESRTTLEHNVSEKMWREWLYPASVVQAAYFIQQFSSPTVLRDKLSKSLDADIVDHDLQVLDGLDCSAAGFRILAEQLSSIEGVYKQCSDIWLTEKDTIVAAFNGGMGRSFTKARLPVWLLELDDYLQNKNNILCGFAQAQRFTQHNIDDKIPKSAPQHCLFSYLETLETLIKSINTILLVRLRVQFIEELEAAQQQQNILFFDDLVKRLAIAVSADDASSIALVEALLLRYPSALIDEFQDTDQWQYSIFENIYAGTKSSKENGSSCLLIGDPKQAIYSFRGADINTYFLARTQVEAQQRYTLATNYRSKPTLVSNVNRLFMQQADAFCIPDFPEYPRVSSPAAFADKKGLHLSNEHSDCNFSVIQISGDIKSKAGTSREQAAEKTAHFIANCLQQHIRIDNQPIEPADIAILVRSSNQASLMKKELLKQGVNSVYLSKDSVLESSEALSFLQLLQAIVNPYDQSLVLAAIAGELISYSAEQVRELNNKNDESARLQQLFIEANQSWVNKGFMSAWQQVVMHFSIAEKLLSQFDGERRVTNLIQLAETFQSLDTNNLALWQKIELFQRQIEEAETGNEQQKLRLETEANLVQIVTIHKSKGLEYPMVCCPFLFDAGRTPPSMYDISFDIASQQRKLYWNAEDAVKKQIYNEQFAEDVRLLYVALTRAESHFNCCWGPVKGVDKTAFYHLLYGRGSTLKSLMDKQFWQVFSMFEGVAFDPQDKIVTSTQHSTSSEGTESIAIDLSANTFVRTMQQRYIARSYSALLQHRSNEQKAFILADEGKERDEDISELLVLPEPAFRHDIFHFPKGSDAGNFMHQVLEDSPFTEPELTLAAVLTNQLLKYGFDSIWQDCLYTHFLMCLNKSLGHKLPALTQLPDSAIVKEMGFYLQARNASGEQFIAILQQYRLGFSAEFKMECVPINQGFSDINGLFKGFIDLVFEHDNQFYIVDYKSNFLGFNEQDYNFSAMHQAIGSHFYDLQFLIYLTALQCHLRQRIKNYAYDTHIGGVHYLFLRGINDKNSNGIYSIKPPRAIIDTLEQLFVGHVYD